MEKLDDVTIIINDEKLRSLVRTDLLDALLRIEKGEAAESYDDEAVAKVFLGDTETSGRISVVAVDTGDMHAHVRIFVTDHILYAIVSMTYDEAPRVLHVWELDENEHLLFDPELLAYRAEPLD